VRAVSKSCGHNAESGGETNPQIFSFHRFHFPSAPIDNRTLRSSRYDSRRANQKFPAGTQFRWLDLSMI
jgi:hypothetical protein